MLTLLTVAKAESMLNYAAILPVPNKQVFKLPVIEVGITPP